MFFFFIHHFNNSWTQEYRTQQKLWRDRFMFLKHAYSYVGIVIYSWYTGLLVEQLATRVSETSPTADMCGIG